MIPLDAPGALERIRVIWLAWAKAQVTTEEAMAGIAELLEESGLPLIADDDSDPR